MVDVHAHLDTIRRVTVTSVVGFIALFIAQSSYPPTFTPEYYVVTAVAAMFATDMILETFFPYQRIRSQTPPRSTRPSDHPTPPPFASEQALSTQRARMQNMRGQGQGGKLHVNLVSESYYSDLSLAHSLLMSIAQAGPLVAVDPNELFPSQG